MNCCDYDCTQGRDCPVRRQPAYPATLPPQLTAWCQAPCRAPRRLVDIAASLAGYALLLIALMCAAAAVATWLAMPAH